MIKKRITLKEACRDPHYLNEIVLSIKTSLFPSQMQLPVLMLVAFGLVALRTNIIPYIIPIIVLSIFLLYELWKIARPINTILLDSMQKSLTLKPRYFVMRVFSVNKTVQYSEIKSFKIEEITKMRTATNYLINACLIDGSAITLTQTSNKALSQQLLIFFRKRIRIPMNTLTY